MKKILAAVSIVLALFVSGCSLSIESSPSDEPTVSASPTPTAPTTSPSESDEVFVEAMRQQFPQLEQATDAELVGAGEEMCALLDAGTPEQAVNRLLNEGVDPDLVGFMMGAAAQTLCPENQGEVQAFIDKYAPSGV